MTFPMPGPPPYGHFVNYYPHEHPDDALGLCPGCHMDARGERASSGKRLTDAECAAEYWRTMFDAAYETPHGYERQTVIVRTWHRFASQPHALEQDTK